MVNVEVVRILLVYVHLQTGVLLINLASNDQSVSLLDIEVLPFVLFKFFNRLRVFVFTHLLLLLHISELLRKHNG